MEKRGYKHGYYGTKVYTAWEDAKSRCNNPKHSEYCRYGAKGISMCSEWITTPKAWCEYLGNPPDNVQKWSVERVNCSSGYQPGNIKWELPDK